MNGNLRAALDWLSAVTARDKERLIALSDAEIGIHGPRGIARGVDVLERWFDTTHLRIVPREAYRDGDRVLVVHDMEWLDAEGGVSGTLRNASVFTIVDGLVGDYQRDDEPEALPRHGFGSAVPEPVDDP
jgi:hypothetical protein